MRIFYSKIVCNLPPNSNTFFSHTNTYTLAITAELNDYRDDQNHVTLVFTLQRSTQIVELGLPLMKA